MTSNRFHLTKCEEIGNYPRRAVAILRIVTNTNAVLD